MALTLIVLLCGKTSARLCTLLCESDQMLFLSLNCASSSGSTSCFYLTCTREVSSADMTQMSCKYLCKGETVLPDSFAAALSNHQ